VSVDFYREKDFLPEALVNYVALLGWSPGANEENMKEDPKSEVFTLSQLTDLFSFNRVHSSNAKLVENKLYFFNSTRLRQHYAKLEDPKTSPQQKQELIQEFKNHCVQHNPEVKEAIENTSDDIIQQILSIVSDRIKLYEDLKSYQFFFTAPDFNSEESQKSRRKVLADLEKSKSLIQNIYQLLRDKIPANNFKMVNIAKVCGEHLFKTKQYSTEEFYHTLRFCLTGVHFGGPITQICEILGKEETLKRVEKWI